MKRIRRSVRQLYVCPTIELVKVEADGDLLVASPLVRPGGGGTPPGGIKVIDPTEEDGGDDDELEG